MDQLEVEDQIGGKDELVTIGLSLYAPAEAAPEIRKV
jgi:hypothetical protein